MGGEDAAGLAGQADGVGEVDAPGVLDAPDAQGVPAAPDRRRRVAGEARCHGSCSTSLEEPIRQPFKYRGSIARFMNSCNALQTPEASEESGHALLIWREQIAGRTELDQA